MKALFITSYGFNDRMRNFIEYTLARLLTDCGNEVFAIACPEKSEPYFEIKDGIKIYKPGGILKTFKLITKLLFYERPDTVHIFNTRNNRAGIIAAVLCYLTGKPFLFTEYGLLHDYFLVSDRDDPYPFDEKIKFDGPILNFKKIFRDFKIKQNIKNYLYHFPLSKAKKTIFVSKHNLWIAQKMGITNAEYFPHICDNKRWPREKSGADSSLLQKLAEEKNRGVNFILFVGQIKLRKGWDTALEAMAEIKPDVNVRLLFVSVNPPEEAGAVFELINQLGIKNKVIFCGRVEGENLKRLYEMSEAVIVPSRYEGFGLAVIEAWEMHKPVVASDVIAINEHVVNGVNGILVPPKNPGALAQAIERVLNDDVLKNKITQGGSVSLDILKSAQPLNQWLKLYSQK
jgi:glycosyltransferase involved in cell wall biosynthesis